MEVSRLDGVRVFVTGFSRRLTFYKRCSVSIRHNVVSDTYRSIYLYRFDGERSG